jgi:CheY-like chemotaxis protein
MKKYKILVVEDTERHIDSAKKQLENAPEVETLTILGGNWDISNQHQKFIKEIMNADVVLTDLNLNCVEYGTFSGGEQKIGALVALTALIKCVPYIGIVTDTKAHGDHFLVGLQLAFNVRGTHNKGYFNGASTVTLSTAVGGEKDWVGALRNLVAGNSLDMFSRKNLNKI